MLAHTTLGCSDIKAANDFYQAILSPIEAIKVFESESVIFWQFKEGDAKLAITKPHDGLPASNGNGTMVALKLANKALVDQVYAIAMDNQGKCEGAPGDRNDGSYYAAYFRDLDNNKLVVFYRE